MIINYANNVQLADNVSTVENRLSHDKCLITCELLVHYWRNVGLESGKWGGEGILRGNGKVTILWKLPSLPGSCTGSCHFDNGRCSQWWKFNQNDISVSVCEGRYMYIFYIFLCFPNSPFPSHVVCIIKMSHLSKYKIVSTDGLAHTCICIRNGDH